MESAVWLNFVLLLAGFSLGGFLLGDRLREWGTREQSRLIEEEIQVLRREVQWEGEVGP